MKQYRPLLNLKPRRPQRRRGFTTPAVAVALLVAMGGLALILDRLWLDAADLELTTAAESAALAAAGELASDDLLRPTADPETRFDLARTSAGWIAAQNVVAGSPVVLDTTQQGDIRLGKLVLDDQTGLVRFEESANFPVTAVVTAMRTRRTSNPVGLFVAGVTGQPFGDVVTRVEASVDNRVCGVRAQDGAPVPALPIAIWWKDPAGQRLDTWQSQIEARKGLDNYGYDAVTHRVYSGSDGIPEITLTSQPGGQSSLVSNMLVVDVGTGLNDQALQRQFTAGWTADDLTPLGGELSVTDASPVPLTASGELRHTDREALDTMIGEPRICLLYSAATPTGNGALVQAACMRMVAIRVLAVQDQSDGSCKLVAQPCIVKTKTAVVNVPFPYSTDGVVPVSPYITPTTTPAATGDASMASPGAPSTANGTPSTNSTTTTTTTNPGNPYIYKLHLTH